MMTMIMMIITSEQRPNSAFSTVLRRGVEMALEFGSAKQEKVN